MNSANAVSSAAASQYNSAAHARRRFLTGGTGFRRRPRRARPGRGGLDGARSRARSEARRGRSSCGPAGRGGRRRALRRAPPIWRERPPGPSAIVHVAGLTKARTLEEYREVNVRGTERLLEAARADRRPTRSSFSSRARPPRAPRAAAARSRHDDPARPVSWYGVSKREAEEAVERLWKGPWIVLRPGVVYGPGDRGLFVYFRMAATGWVPVPAGRTRIQIVGAERAALAIARAAARPTSPGRSGFSATPEAVTVGDLAAAIAGFFGAARAVSSGCRTSSCGSWGCAETVRRDPDPAFSTLQRRQGPGAPGRRLALRHRAVGAGALALPAPVPLSEGLSAAWDWYRAAGWLPGRARFVKFAKIRPPVSRIRQGGSDEQGRPGDQTGGGGDCSVLRKVLPVRGRDARPPDGLLLLLPRDRVRPGSRGRRSTAAG